MTPLRNAGIRLVSSIIALSARGDRDRGEGPVSYIAVVLLISVIVIAVVASGVGDTIVGYIESAVAEVWNNRNDGASS